MRIICVLLLLVGVVSLEAAPASLAVAAAATPGTATAVWDANTDSVTVGYRLFYGLAPGLIETAGRVEAGAATIAAVSGLMPGRTYFFHVRAYDAAGMVGLPSAEVSLLVPGLPPPPPPDPCAFPLGATSVSIFVTGRLNKTGSGGAGSRAYITFQAASPNSPIVALAIRANGTDIPDSVTAGTSLRATGSLWFTIPPGPAIYVYSVFAQNAAGCVRDQPTGFTSTVP